MQEPKLHHLVLIEFKDKLNSMDLDRIEKAAYNLNTIQGVHNLRFSKNVSPEGLHKGYSRSLTMYFKNESDRDQVYLPHPIHQTFVKLFVPFTQNVLVYDYWEE